MEIIRYARALSLAIAASAAACRGDRDADVITATSIDQTLEASAAMNPALIAEGKTIFRFDTFGDETFWTDTLRMHEVIRTSVSPNTALQVGLKVDVDALPAEIKARIQNRTIDLDAPATTVALIGLGAVVGVVGQVDASNTLTRVGINLEPDAERGGRTHSR